MNDSLRALFPVTRRANYLNHAAVSPPPVGTIEAIQSQLRDVSENGSVNFRSWLSTRERTRQLLAEMLAAQPQQVAFLRNTSDALSTVANGLDWKRGGNLVTFRNEFPSNIYPWLRLREAFGVEVRMCEERDGRIDLDELTAMIDGSTRLVAISHIQYASGFRADLERIGRAARAHDALLVVDAIQSLGVVPMDVEAQLVDVAAGACHKWLLTPEGVGWLYLSNRARERVKPTLVGWTSVPNPEDYSNFDQDWNLGTLAWETGTGPVSIIHGLEASLQLLKGIGIQTIQNHLETLTDHLCQRLRHTRYQLVSSRLPNEKSAIVCIRNGDGLSPLELYSHLKKKNIVTAPRGDRLRISPHVYNTLEEIDELVNQLP